MASTQVSLDIVLPCYNPRPDWAERVVNSYSEIQKRLTGISISLIIVNDGSQKNVDEESLRIIRAADASLRYIDYDHNMGKGYALRKGVAQSKAQYLIYTDIDFPYEEASLIVLADMLISGDYDIVVGIRNQSYYDHSPALRRVISKFLRWMIRNAFHISITDTQGGLKGFNRKGQEVFLETTINRYLFDLQFIYLASRKKELRITPLEVHLKSDVVFSRMKLKILIGELINFLKILCT